MLLPLLGTGFKLLAVRLQVHNTLGFAKASIGIETSHGVANEYRQKLDVVVGRQCTCNALFLAR